MVDCRRRVLGGFTTIHACRRLLSFSSVCVRRETAMLVQKQKKKMLCLDPWSCCSLPHRQSTQRRRHGQGQVKTIVVIGHFALVCQSQSRLVSVVVVPVTPQSLPVRNKPPPCAIVSGPLAEPCCYCFAARGPPAAYIWVRVVFLQLYGVVIVIMLRISGTSGTASGLGLHCCLFHRHSLLLLLLF